MFKIESAVKNFVVPPTKISWSPMMLIVSRENLRSPIRRSLIINDDYVFQTLCTVLDLKLSNSKLTDNFLNP